MKLRFIGSNSPSGSCPTLYATDRGTYIVQGLSVADPEALSDLRHVLPGETVVEIPAELLAFFAQEHAAQ
jgi:hypothetical protein